MNVTKIDAARVAKQLEQIKTMASTTVVGIVFKKPHNQLCIADDMSKDAAIASIVDDLTGLSKNAMPVLDVKAHKLEDSALGRDSLEWDTPKKAAAGLHRLLSKEINNECYSDMHYGASLSDHTFHDLEIHTTGETITAEQIRQLFVVPALSESLHGSHGSTENNDNDTDDNEQEELDTHEYESDFEDAGITSEDEDKVLMAFALLLIKQRLLPIQLTIQAKQGQSEQLQLNKKTAAKSLMTSERRYEHIENLMEQYEAPHVPVEGIEHSDNEDEDQVPTAQELLATKLTMITTQIKTSEEAVQVAHCAGRKSHWEAGLSLGIR